ncbi:hypothetical protein EDC96DRAFT_503294 [Choanephora cucurbitarum]|nr:hypothetical protein EDC96DRAFT_503294 [Choanephora cucurbitarum]
MLVNMEPFITKGQASYMVLGEAVTKSNRLKCKAIIEETPFEVVYTIAEGKMRPVAVGKQVVERDLIYLLSQDELNKIKERVLFSAE